MTSYHTDVISLFREDVPKLDSGVRMLCLDGGGAKGVIEATVLDKVFLSVSAALTVRHAIVIPRFTGQNPSHEDPRKSGTSDKIGVCLIFVCLS